MKINLNKLINGLIDFNINSAVASCIIGLFQDSDKGYFATACFLSAFVLLCIGKKGEEK